jgi:hypothetical protein
MEEDHPDVEANETEGAVKHSEFRMNDEVMEGLGTQFDEILSKVFQ